MGRLTLEEGPAGVIAALRMEVEGLKVERDAFRDDLEESERRREVSDMLHFAAASQRPGDWDAAVSAIDQDRERMADEFVLAAEQWCFRNEIGEGATDALIQRLRVIIAAHPARASEGWRPFCLKPNPKTDSACECCQRKFNRHEHAVRLLGRVANYDPDRDDLAKCARALIGEVQS